MNLFLLPEQHMERKKKGTEWYLILLWSFMQYHGAWVVFNQVEKSINMIIDLMTPSCRRLRRPSRNETDSKLI